MIDHIVPPARRAFWGCVCLALLAFAPAVRAADAPPAATPPAATPPPAAPPPAGQESKEGITHAFFATGGETYFVAGDGQMSRRLAPGRDGWVLPNGNVLLAASKSGQYPGGAVVEYDKDGKVLFEFKGSQAEIATVQPLEGGNIMTIEEGPKPRLMEINREGKILLEFPLQCQVNDFHMQVRMARKLANGNYLVPHLIDKIVKEYDPQGKVVWECKTPAEPRDAWPFTAIRLDNGNTLIDCTHGNMVIEVDKDGKIVWQLTNADLPTPLLKDPCGGQRLPNGNTVITSYGAGGAGEVKMLEVTRDKQVVWTFRSGKNGGVHEFQILDTNGKPVEGRLLR